MKNYEINLSIKAISVLREIYNSPGIDILKITNIYGIQSEYYTQQLLDYELIEDRRHKLHPNDKGKYLGCYVITNAGIAYLENYRLIVRNSKKDFLVRNILIPAVVSIITNLVIISLTTWLPRLL